MTNRPRLPDGRSSPHSRPGNRGIPVATRHETRVAAALALCCRSVARSGRRGGSGSCIYLAARFASAHAVDRGCGPVRRCPRSVPRRPAQQCREPRIHPRAGAGRGGLCRWWKNPHPPIPRRSGDRRECSTCTAPCAARWCARQLPTDVPATRQSELLTCIESQCTAASGSAAHPVRLCAIREADTRTPRHRMATGC